FDVDPRVGGQLETVAPGGRFQRMAAQQLAQLAHEGTQRNLVRTRRLLGPQQPDQLIARDGAFALEHQVGEGNSALPPGELAGGDQVPVQLEAQLTGQIDMHRLPKFRQTGRRSVETKSTQEAQMAVTITTRARLKADAATIKKIHDEVTGATKEMARQAGDISHAVYLSGKDHRDFLCIDTSPSTG